MKKIMFYCQHIVGMGHLIRSTEIIRGLVSDFQVCLINGGEIIDEFPLPPSVEVVNIPAIKTDAQWKELQPVDSSLSLKEVQLRRTEQILNVFERFKPDILILELFPFGRRRFSFELIPLLEKAKAAGTKIVCSLRDIVVNQNDRQRHEEKVCNLIDRYFDLLLVHGDPQFVRLEEIFDRLDDLNCQVCYTGYVTQSLSTTTPIHLKKPLILVTVGGGRFGHDLLECVVKTAPLLQDRIPHQIQVFTGPFMLEETFNKLQDLAGDRSNLKIERYTPQLLNYMQQADLSISMCGYNTTMNILNTGVRAMMMAFTGSDDREQTIRLQKLAELEIAKAINPEDLQPEQFATQIINYLQQQPIKWKFDFNGVANTAACLQNCLFQEPAIAA
ncbi:MAG: glycosyltransferase family protein [Xenococcaceae cyanobacterium]